MWHLYYLRPSIIDVNDGLNIVKNTREKYVYSGVEYVQYCNIGQAETSAMSYTAKFSSFQNGSQKFAGLN
jgi:hypothetical protein